MNSKEKNYQLSDKAKVDLSFIHDDLKEEFEDLLSDEDLFSIF